jgi:hypothetical protein
MKLATNRLSYGPPCFELAHFWSTFDPEDPEAILRYRSSPWDEISDDDLPSGDEMAITDGEDVSETVLPFDSPQVNILGHPPPPTIRTKISVRDMQLNMQDFSSVMFATQGAVLPQRQR